MSLHAVPDAPTGPFPQHSPGPWRPAANGSLWVYGPPGTGPMPAGESPAIAVTFFPHDRHLVAAAPDMAAILTAVVPRLSLDDFDVACASLTDAQAALLGRFRP